MKKENELYIADFLNMNKSYNSSYFCNYILDIMLYLMKYYIWYKSGTQKGYTLIVLRCTYHILYFTIIVRQKDVFVPIFNNI